MPKLLYKVIQCCTECPYLFFDPDADMGYCNHPTVIDRQLEKDRDIQLFDISMGDDGGFNKAMNEEEINNSTPSWCPMPNAVVRQEVVNDIGQIIQKLRRGGQDEKNQS